MCGIFASIEPFHSVERLRTASLRGQRRGPENSTEYTIKHKIFFSFHRLAINGVSEPLSNQPMCLDGCVLICNGEIYNWTNLHEQLSVPNVTKSDCEIVIHLYRRFGMLRTLNMLDGVFAFVLYDAREDTTFIARDAFGVRPLFRCAVNNIYASELKMLSSLTHTVRQFEPGTCMQISKSSVTSAPFSNHNAIVEIPWNRSDALYNVRNSLCHAVRKRVHTSDRGITCLLSGGLDSSLVCALVAKELHPKKLHTWSIGMQGSPDLEHAQIAADHIGTIHHSIELTQDEFIASVEQVVETIESFDITTVRASVGNWLICKYIREQSDAKVVFNGDGADEVCGGYIYMCNAPDKLEFDRECRRLLGDIHYFDVLRSDRCISAHGLEARTPFLDRSFVQTYLSVPAGMRMAYPGKEKQLLREAFNDTNLLPNAILHRRKEAFSDGVSHISQSWYRVLQQRVGDEGRYYRRIMENYYPQCSNVIPYAWMPRYVEAEDPSARTLEIYRVKSHGPAP